MAVLVTTRIPSLPGEVYDGIATQLADPLRAAHGFVAHAAVADADGVTVTELWNDAGDWERFFDTHVKPNLPPDAPEPERVELRNTIVA